VTRVFVICVPEDSRLFDRLGEQARSARLQVEFDRMQVKEPWIPAWKGQARTRIFKCNGAIVLLSKNTNKGGLAWELECARAVDLPMLGIQADKIEKGSVPQELIDSPVLEWSWPDIQRFIQGLGKAAGA
jgi:hypothetical protein